MRLVFYTLLLANLAYFAWAKWVDTPHRAPTNEVISRLPALKLVEAGSPPAAQAPSGGSVRMSLNPTGSCLSVGPFPTPEASTHAAELLGSKGFFPRQRSEDNERPDGYWVYVGGLKNQAETDRALATLRKNGIKDAVAMPGRLSLGLYKERPRADHRAEVVQQTGLKAEVAERRIPETAYWVDLAPPPGVSSVPLDELFAEGVSSKVAVQPCPADAAPPPASGSGTAPAATTPATGTATTKPEPAAKGPVTASNPPPAVPRVPPQ